VAGAEAVEAEAEARQRKRHERYEGARERGSEGHERAYRSRYFSDIRLAGGSWIFPTPVRGPPGPRLANR
jgi:hypothetical protein